MLLLGIAFSWERCRRQKMTKTPHAACRSAVSGSRCFSGRASPVGVTSIHDPWRKDAQRTRGNSPEAPFADAVARRLGEALQDRGIKIRQFLDRGIVP